MRSTTPPLLALLLLASPGCSSSSAETSPAPASTESTASSGGAAAAPSSTSGSCGGRAVPAGFTCLNAAIVLAANAPADLDPCPPASCPADTRCESSTQTAGGAAHRLPRCVPTTPTSAAPAPMRDPCANYRCPAGYQCTAPADAPYCAPNGPGW